MLWDPVTFENSFLWSKNESFKSHEHLTMWGCGTFSKSVCFNTGQGGLDPWWCVTSPSVLSDGSELQSRIAPPFFIATNPEL